MQKVSVIIPTFNRSNFIIEALESIFIQEYFPLEIIIVDDGSTDDTKKVLKPYLDRIQYIYQENKGLGPARNRGIEKATGEYIAFLDSDDRWKPNKLKVQVDLLNVKPNIAVVCTDFVNFSEDGIIFGGQRNWEAYRRYHLSLEGQVFKHKAKLSEFIPNIQSDFKDTFVLWGNIFEYYLWGPLLFISTALFRKKCIEEIYDELFDYNYTHDFYMFARIAQKYPIAFIDKPLVEKRSRIKEKHGQAAQLTSEKHQIPLRLEYLQLTVNLWVKNKTFYKTHKKAVNYRLGGIHSDLAYKYRKIGNYKKAFKHFQKSISYHPFQKRTYFYLMETAIRSLINELLH